MQKLQNRIEKLIKIESTLNREIKFTNDKSRYFKSLQKTNMANLQQKREHKAKILHSIETKRRSLSISRQEQRANKEKAFELNLNIKKSKADLIKSLKLGWDKGCKERRSEDLDRKVRFAKKVKEIERKNKEFRSQSQASNRKIVEGLYKDRIGEQESIAQGLRKEMRELGEVEEKLVERLSNTISLRNNQLNGLNNLIAISKLPISWRLN